MKENRKHNKGSALNRFILTTLAAVTVVFVVMIAFVTKFLFSRSIDHAKEIDAINAGQVTSSLSANFDNMTHWLHLTGQSLSGLDFQSDTLDASVADILTTTMKTNPNIHCAWLILDNNVRNGDKHYIKELLREGEGINEVPLKNIEEDLQVEEDSLWYYKPMSTGEIYINTTNLYDYGTGDGAEYVVSISMPIQVNGELLGACGIDIRYKDILDHHYTFSDSRERNVVMLLSQDMTVLHAFDPALTGKSFGNLGYESGIVEEARAAMAQGKEYSHEIVSPFLGAKTFFYLQPISFGAKAEQDYLYLLISTPINSLKADAYYIVGVAAVACVLCMFLIIGIVFVGANRIVRPIKLLAGQARQVASGDFDVDIFSARDGDARADSEVATLRRAFHEMLYALRDNLQVVEERVEERTRELKKLNNYIKLLVESTANISILLDKDLNILYCSENYLRLLCEQDISAIRGKPFESTLAKFTDQGYIERGRHRLKRALTEETRFMEDDAITWPDGTSRLYRIVYSQVKDDDHSFLGMAVIMRDLTDIRVEEAERRLEDLLQSTPLPCLVWDEAGEVVAYNHEAASIFGISELATPEAFNESFKSFQPVLQPDGRVTADLRRKVVEEARKNGFTHVTAKLADSEDRAIYFNVTAARISWLSGYRIVLYYSDITNDMNALNEAKEAEERVKLMFDSNPMICIMRNDQGRVIDCNQEALNLFGVTKKSVFCENFSDYFPAYQPDGVKSADRMDEVLRIVDEEGPVNFERTLLTPAGELIPVDTKIIKIPWKNSYYYLSFSLDLREAKANEQKIRETEESEREAWLQSEAAQAANEAKSQFLANMSHEIRTPMNAILGMSELLIQENLSNRQMRYTQDIKLSASALLDIINDILDVSKIQAGKLSLNPVHYDFGMLIDNIGSMAQFLVEDKDVSFKLTIPDHAHICLYGDDVRLRQVLVNLLSNAVKFTEEGQIHLKAGLTEDTVEITISDTGAGIPPESISTLFGAFEQADTMKNRSVKGTGLGLTITKAIVEMMDGSIEVESVYGKGSSFRIVIPKILGDETQIRHVDEESAVIYIPEAKVLVVDDNRTNLNVSSGLLQLFGITTETAESGGEAIELLRQNEYDLVFMDHRMPEMSGIETTKIIRQMGMDVPIIALTASAFVGAKEMMITAGMDDYLWKPIVKAELIRILKKWIPAEKIQEPPAAAEESKTGEDEGLEEFWKMVERIDGLSLPTGLKRADGQRDLFRKTLDLMVREIEKSDINLQKFLLSRDMGNFRIEVHGIKGSLANVGAMEMSGKARELEMASAGGDMDFCAENLPALLEELAELKKGLNEAFSSIRESSGPIVIPPELPGIFQRLIGAFDEVDFVLIDQEIEKLDAIELSGAIKEEVERIKDMVMMMDYEEVTEYMQRLLEAA